MDSAMRVAEYLVGRRVDLALPLPPQACADRLKALVPAHEWPIGHRRLLGKVEGDWISLRYNGPLFERRYRQALEGSLMPDGGGTRLIGRFGSVAPLVALVAFIALSVGLAAAAVRDAVLLGTAPAVQIGCAAAIGLAACYFVFRDIGVAEQDWDRITDAICEACAE